MSWRERREREKERKNAVYSGHLRLCQQPRAAHTLRSDQNDPIFHLVHPNTSQCNAYIIPYNCVGMACHSWLITTHHHFITSV